MPDRTTRGLGASGSHFGIARKISALLLLCCVLATVAPFGLVLAIPTPASATDAGDGGGLRDPAGGFLFRFIQALVQLLVSLFGRGRGGEDPTPQRGPAEDRIPRLPRVQPRPLGGAPQRDRRSFPFFRAPSRRSAPVPPAAPSVSLALPPGVIITSHTYGSDPRQTLDVFTDRSFRNAPIAVLIHGGGWITGSKERMHWYVSFFHDLGFVVITPNYRLATATGQHTFPTPVSDVACAVAWVKANASEYGADRSKVILMGSSAGAHIGALLAYHPKGNWRETCAIGESNLTVKGFIGGAGVYDFDLVPQERTEVRHFLGNSYGPGRWNAAEPINFVSPGDPPALIITGDRDAQVNAQNSFDFVNALKAKGIPVTLLVRPGVGHGAFSRFESDTELQSTMTSFIRSVVP